MRVGIIEFTALPGLTISGRIWSSTFGPRYASVMPQAVSSWLRQAGHTVYYRVYYGQCSPLKLLPHNLDVLFLVTTCRTASVAEQVARSWEHPGIRIIACGPYPAGNPEACLAWAHNVVVSCNRSSILDITESHDDGETVNEPFDINETPLLRDRIPEVRQTFTSFLPRKLQVIPLLHSVGCPNKCSFCVERNRKYRPRKFAVIEDDLHTTNEVFPGRLVAWHDPNWGIRGSAILDILESIPNRSNRYIVELQLSRLNHDFLHRLKHAGVTFVAVGIESWTEFNDKVGIHESTPRNKMESVVEKLSMIHRYIPHVQANMIVGFDSDTKETWQLTKEAIAQTPWCQWNVNPLTAFPGTEVRRQFEQEDRLLPFPPEMMTDPFITHSLNDASYSPAGHQMLATEFYKRLLDLYQFRVRHGLKALLRTKPSIAAVHFLHLADILQSVHILKTLLKRDDELFDFHDIRVLRSLPPVYEQLRQRWLEATD